MSAPTPDEAYQRARRLLPTGERILAEVEAAGKSPGEAVVVLGATIVGATNGDIFAVATLAAVALAERRRDRIERYGRRANGVAAATGECTCLTFEHEDPACPG